MKLEDTKLYKHLQTLDKDNTIMSILKNTIEVQFVPLLNNICIRMPEYTSHSESHSLNIIYNMWQIIPQETKNILSTTEILLLIYSAYLHDIGMFISDDDLQNIPKCAKYKELECQLKNKNGQDFSSVDILKEYVRLHHGQRSISYIEDNKNLFIINGIDYSFILKQICCGHTLDIEEIKKYSSNTLIGTDHVNVMYLTIILRIADLLDICPNRTPFVLFEKMKPKNNVSIQEWQKHLSITGWNIETSYVEIHAMCSEYNVERNLHNFIQYINSEINNCALCFNDKNGKYKFNLKGNISTDNIHSDGSYIYNELKFELNTSNIISLLMGNRLYSQPIFALRELLQNSIDAVLYRQKLENAANIEYSPEIKININDNKLIIEDNGIGMDINIFKKYFMSIGKSYYQSFESKENVKDYSSISEFGIGILSTFMIANTIQVESKLRPYNTNSQIDPILIDIPTIDDYFIQRKTNKQTYGTKIVLNLKENHPFKQTCILQFIKSYAPLINPNIKLIVNDVIYKNALQNNSYDSVIDLRKCKIYHSFNIDSDEFGIKGKVFLLKEQEKYVKCENIIAKNGFKISCANLLPTWANIRAVFNITNPEIKLSANREAFIVNEKFNELKIFLEEKIENEIYKYLLNIKKELTENNYIQYLYELISNEVLFDNYCYKSNKIIPKKLEELIFLPVIDENYNKQFKNIKELFLSDKIATFTRVPLKYKEKFNVPYDEIFNLSKNLSQNIPLINNPEINSFATHKILSALGLYVESFITTSINGFVIFILSKSNSEIPYSRYWNTYNFSKTIITKKQQEILFIELQPYKFVTAYPDIVLNANHYLIQPFLKLDEIKDSYENGEIKKIFDKLKDKLHQAYRLCSFDYKNEKSTANIKCAYINELNNCAKNLWDTYKKYKLVPQNRKFRKFKDKDFLFDICVEI